MGAQDKLLKSFILILLIGVFYQLKRASSGSSRSSPDVQQWRLPYDPDPSTGYTVLGRLSRIV